MTKRTLPKATVELDLDRARQFVVTGRGAETARLLLAKGRRGVTAYDFPGGAPFRLPAYVHTLRRMGWPITTQREPHCGGSHGRFVLECSGRIVDATWTKEADHVR